MSLTVGKLYRTKISLLAGEDAFMYNVNIPEGSTLMLIKDTLDKGENRLYCQFLFGMKSCCITFSESNINPYSWAMSFLDPID